MSRPRRDYWMALAFFLVALAMRIPFRSHFAYHWDSAQFALAIRQFDIRLSQPQAPGFYLYIILGRLVNLMVGDPHASLVWVSVLSGAWLAAAGYLLATSMFGRRCGFGTGLILLTNPLCWFHSEIALTTIVDSALVVTFMFVAWRALRDGVTWTRTIVLAALLAAVAGVRLQSAPLLLPLLLYVFYCPARPCRQKLLIACLLAAGFSLLWFIPTVNSTGGLESYIDVLRLKSRFDAPKTIWGGGGLDALLTNVSGIGRSCWVGLLGAAIISAVESIRWVFFVERATKEAIYRANREQICFLALWGVPMVLFWTFMYITMPGYVLNLFPSVAILAGLGIARFSRWVVAAWPGAKPWFLCSVWAFVVAINISVFLFSPGATMRPLLGLPLTAMEIYEHDAGLSACFQAIRQNWPSGNVVVCHRREEFYWGFRQFEYYLPEYTNLLLVADSSLPGTPGMREWIGYQRQTIFQTGVPIPAGDDILLVVPPEETVELFKDKFEVRGAHLFAESKVKLFLLHP